jgi:hypothetical protein
MKRILPYLPGLLIVAVLFVLGMRTSSDYGVSWDEPDQRYLGTLVYNFVFEGKKEFLSYPFRFYGSGYELLLAIFEKTAKLTDTRAIYLQRHLVTHTFFLLAGLSLYLMSYRLSRNIVVPIITLIIFLLSPRIFAHSFFNTKDIPFLCMFTITMATTQWAFERNKIPHFVVLGLCAGYATSIRVMGVMLFVFILAMLVIDWIRADGADKKRQLWSLLGFGGAYMLATYVAWPYLWSDPFTNFGTAYTAMSQYDWKGTVLLHGVYEDATALPSSYFPTWFVMSTPILWVPLGLVGGFFVFYDFFKSPKQFVANTPQRIFLFVALCFIAPVFAVIKLHSVLYDDWRHLYFVYPAFTLLACYLMYRFCDRKTQYIFIGLAGIQAAIVVVFMIQNHPFQQVYFNELVSHKDEYLRENYELDYWGSSFKQGLEFIAKKDRSDTVNIAVDSPNHSVPVANNLLILPLEDRKRLKIVGFPKAKYFITNFRFHPDDYPDKKNPSKDYDFNVKVLNSSIMRVYNLKNINKLPNSGQ